MTGKIIVENGAYPEPHEIYTATVLAKERGDIVFVAPVFDLKRKNPDIKMQGLFWEMKASKTSKISGLEQCLKRATRQSGNIIIDSYRIKKLSDNKVECFLETQKDRRVIKKLIFINKRRKIIDIK